MKEILIKIADILYQMKDIDRDKVVMILDRLDNEKQAQNFLNWIEKNQNNQMDYMEMIEIAEKM